MFRSHVIVTQLTISTLYYILKLLIIGIHKASNTKIDLIHWNSITYNYSKSQSGVVIVLHGFSRYTNT